MARTTLVTPLLLALAALASADADMDAKSRPVMKVVRLLEDMEAELKRDLEDDKQVHEMLHCWCKTNREEKEQAIALGEAKIKELEAFLGEKAAQIKELKAKRKNTWDELQKDHAALQEAETMRMKENKEFHKEEVDLIEAIKACGQAVVALSKHHPDLVQVRSVARLLQTARVTQIATGTAMSHTSMLVLKEFISGAEQSASFLAIPGFQSYAPQSGQIFGVLKQMKENFEEDISAAQKEEAKAVAEFQALKKAKEEEIAAGQKMIKELDAQIAEFGEEVIAAMKELDDTEKQLALDKEFLANLEKKCSMTDEEFEKRLKDRLTEIEAVEDTIKILNTDQSFNVAGKTVNEDQNTVKEAVNFIQESSVAKERRKRAVDVLNKAAGRTGAPQLALIAMSAQLDEFTKVKAEIDKMVVELSKQQEDEVAHRDWCIKEMNDNKRETAAGYDKKKALQTKIADLKTEIERLTKAIEAAKTQIAETETSMQRASESREGENAAFLQTVSDQRLAQIILQKALTRMKEVYLFLQKPGAPHIQTSATHTDPGNGPAAFKKYEKNRGGARVVAMIDEVIADSKKTENEAIASENDSQQEYENTMKQSNKLITQLQKSIMHMKGSKAKAKEDIGMAKADLTTTVNTLKALHDEDADLGKSCDYIIKNFDARQAARAAEIEALREAKGILSGAK